MTFSEAILIIEICNRPSDPIQLFCDKLLHYITVIILQSELGFSFWFEEKSHSSSIVRIFFVVPEIVFVFYYSVMDKSDSIKIRFNGKNFSRWAFHLQHFVARQGLLECLDGFVPEGEKNKSP